MQQYRKYHNKLCHNLNQSAYTEPCTQKNVSFDEFINKARFFEKILLLVQMETSVEAKSVFIRLKSIFFFEDHKSIQN